MSSRLTILLLIAIVLAWLTWSSRSETTSGVSTSNKKTITDLELPTNKLNSGENLTQQASLLIPRKSLIQDSNLKEIRGDLFKATQPETKPAYSPPQTSVQLHVENPVQFNFSYLGKKYEDQRWTVFLSSQGKTLLASETSILESDYQVTKLRPPVMEITHLPSKQTQTISIGSVD